MQICWLEIYDVECRIDSKRALDHDNDSDDGDSDEDHSCDDDDDDEDNESNNEIRMEKRFASSRCLPMEMRSISSMIRAGSNIGGQYQKLHIQSSAPDDGRRLRPKRVELTRNK